MQPSGSEAPNPPETHEVVEHVEDARELLTTLQERIGEHPELAQAILKLETALSILTVKTSGLL